MTLVYAQKLTDCILFFADTFSEVSLTKKKTHWYLEPIVKVIPILDNWVIAFAGNSHTAETALMILHEDIELDVREHLLKVHLDSLNSEAEVEFAIADKSNLRLDLIKEGRIQEVSTCYLGSKTAFEIFQEVRHDQSYNHISELTFTNINCVPEGISESSQNAYSSLLSSFQAALLSPDNTFGGFTVPYLIKSDKSLYMGYLQNFRGPIDDVEIGITGVGIIPHNDQLNGGYQLIFGKGERCFSAHFVNGNCGFIYHSFENNKLEPAKLTNIDPYDFWYEANKSGCNPPIISWKSPHNDVRKSRQLMQTYQLERAQNLIDEISSDLSKKLTSQGGDISIDLSESILKSLSEQPEIIVTIPDIDLISNLFDLRLNLYRLQGNLEKYSEIHREWITWHDQLSKARFAISLKLPEMDLLP